MNFPVSPPKTIRAQNPLTTSVTTRGRRPPVRKNPHTHNHDPSELIRKRRPKKNYRASPISRKKKPRPLHAAGVRTLGRSFPRTAVGMSPRRAPLGPRAPPRTKDRISASFINSIDASARAGGPPSSERRRLQGACASEVARARRRVGVADARAARCVVRAQPETAERAQ